MSAQDACDLEESNAELEECVANFDGSCRDMQAKLSDVQRQINTRRIEKESMSDKYSRVGFLHFLHFLHLTYT